MTALDIDVLNDDTTADDAANRGSSATFDVDSFEEFFASNHGPVTRALAVTLGHQDLGRDASAEGFARALQKWERVSTYANPAGWVYRVGLNWARSRRRKTVREVSALAAADVAAAQPADRDPRVVPALLALSVDHRAVVVGRFYFDWSEAQLADALGIRPGTVKSRLSRALDQLSSTLGTTE